MFVNQDRFKSKLMWSSIIAQILSILVALGVINTGMSETLNTVCVGILQMLVFLGVLNNPTSADTL